MLDILRRQSTFEEVRVRLDETNALFEARRSLSCGNCYGVCPDNAVIKLGPGKRFQFNYAYWKGCDVCAQECPCGAVSMKPKTI